MELRTQRYVLIRQRNRNNNSKVNTMNYEGKRKRVMSQTGFHYYKYRDFKKAVVTFTDELQDVGLGTRVSELEEEETDGV